MTASPQGHSEPRPISARRVVMDNGEVAAERHLTISSDQIQGLSLLSSARLSGFASIRTVTRRPQGVVVRESYLDGFSLEHARTAVRSFITVNLALAFVLDLARALHRLHDLAAPDTLIHGNVDMRKVMLTRDGRVWLVGLTGLQGDPQKDIDDLMALMRRLLASRAENPQGAALLEKLASLRFPSAKALAISVEAYLSRQDAGVLATRRHRFVEQVGRLVRDPLLPMADEAPTELQPRLSFDLDSTQDSERPWQELLEESLTGLAEYPTNEESPRDVREITQENDNSEWLARTEEAVAAEDSAEFDVDIDLDLDLDVDLDEDVKDALLGAVAPASAPPPPPPATSVDVGNYRVVASIGRGGMGEIYLGRAIGGPRLGELAALKVLSSTTDDDVDALDMLLDEARILAHIKHPGVLKVLDFGQAHGKYFLASEYLEGRPLVRVMIKSYAEEGGIEHGVVAALGSLAAEGLYAAHTACLPDGTPLEVVHRDVSPQNIFVTYSGEAKVIDFGVARAVERVSKTQAGLVKGKAAYMSPEQVEGQAVDARSDVFSLGICLWEMVAGRRLFKQDQEYDTLLAVQTLDIEPPTVVRGHPSPVLDHIIMKALERDPTRRTSSARELAQELEDYSRAQGVSDRQQSIGQLLDRLFGEEAFSERALIKQLEQRAATQAEIDKLRELSGVAQAGHGGRMTWVAEPGGLEALDDYGTSEPPRERVLAAVQQVDRQRQRTPLANPLVDDKTMPLLVDESELPPDDSDDQFVILVPDGGDETRPGTPIAARRSRWVYAAATLFVLSLVVAGVYAYTAFGLGERQSAGLAVSKTVVPPIDEPPSSALGAPDEAASPLVAEATSLGDTSAGDVAAATGTASALANNETVAEAQVILRSPEPSEEEPVVAEALELAVAPAKMVEADPASDEPTDEEILAATPVELVAPPPLNRKKRPKKEPAKASVTDAPPPPVKAASPKAASPPPVKADDPPKAAPPPPPAKADPPEAAPKKPEPPKAAPKGFVSGRPNTLLDALKARGFSVTKSRGTYLLSDGRGGSLAVSTKARLTGRNGGGLKGWVVDNKRNRLTTVGLLALDAQGKATVRGVSINDCPARVKVGQDALQISYGAVSQSLPLDGGPLVDARIDVPEGATGLVLQPLGLAFGETEGQGLKCRTGWWGRRVVLRRLPPGSYSVSWTGIEQPSSDLVVRRGSVEGGQHVRTRGFE